MDSIVTRHFIVAAGLACFLVYGSAAYASQHEDLPRPTPERMAHFYIDSYLKYRADPPTLATMEAVRKAIIAYESILLAPFDGVKYLGERLSSVQRERLAEITQSLRGKIPPEDVAVRAIKYYQRERDGYTFDVSSPVEIIDSAIRDAKFKALYPGRKTPAELTRKFGSDYDYGLARTFVLRETVHHR